MAIQDKCFHAAGSRVWELALLREVGSAREESTSGNSDQLDEGSGVDTQ